MSNTSDQVLLWTIASVGLTYFSVAVRRVDFFTIGFFAASIYFVPGFVGFVMYPRPKGLVEVNVVPDAYLVMAVVLGAILVAAMLLDRFGPRHGPSVTLVGWTLAPGIAVALALLGFAGSCATIGAKLLMVDKFEMLKFINRWYVLWTTGAVVGAALAYEARRWVIFGIAGLLLVFDLIVGFRASVAMTLVTVFVLTMSKKGPFRLVGSWRAIVMGGCAVAALVLYKGFFMDVKAGDWALIISHASDLRWYRSVLMTSEPFVTQAILNEVLRSGFKVGLDHMWAWLYQLTLFAPQFGAHAVSFNDLFQTVLFPGSDYMGMANNPWAEAISTAGWPMLIIFSMAFVFVLGLGSYLIAARSGAIRAGTAVLVTWFAVYGHRNDVFTQLNFEKRMLLVWIASVLGSMLTVAALSSARNRPTARLLLDR